MRYTFIPILLCFFLSVIYLLPQILLPQPNLLDIAETWSLGTNLVENLYWDFQSTERFRPLYVVHHTLMNMVFGYRPQLYFVGFALMLAITIYLLIARDKQIHWTDGFILLLVFISPITIDTYWRLGTAENLFGLLLILLVRLCVTRRYTEIVIVAALLMLAKETAIFYIPLCIGYLLFYRRFWHGAILFVLYIGFIGKLLPLVQMAISQERSYTSLFSAAPNSIVTMIRYYVQTNIFYACIFLFSLCVCIYTALVHKKRAHQWSHVILPMLFVLAGLLSIAFFHNKNQPYYFFPTFITILFFLKQQLETLQGKAKLLSCAYLLCIGVLAGIGQSTFYRAVYWQNDYIGDGVLLEQITGHKRDRVYEFDALYRPELPEALAYIYRDVDTSRPDVDVYKITSLHSAIPRAPGVTSLCGKTFGQSTHCKWGVYKGH